MPQDSNELVEYDFDQVVRETPTQWFVEVDGDVLDFPKSICHIEQNPQDEHGTIWVPEWLAIEKAIV